MVLRTIEWKAHTYHLMAQRYLSAVRDYLSGKLWIPHRPLIYNCRSNDLLYRDGDMEQEIRILLIDDHGLFRESLGRLLEGEPGFRVAGSCVSAADAIPLLIAEEIDVVLLDYDLGHEPGSLFLDQARAIGFTGRVLMVTGGMSDADTLHA